MKKLLACLLCMMLLFVATACAFSPESPSSDANPSNPNENESTPPAEEIENRAQLLNGMSLEEKAIFLWNGMFKEDSDINDTVDSATMEMAMTITGTSMGYSLSADVKNSTTHVEGEGQIKPFEYEETTATIKMGEDLLNQTTTTKRGYADGKIFEYSSKDGKSYGVYAAHSPAEWKEYQALIISDSNTKEPVIEENSCTTKNFEWVGQNYAVSFSDFSKDGLASLNESFGDMVSLLDQTPTDALLTATFRRDLLPSEMKIEFVFEGDESVETAPSVVITITFKNYNKASAFAIDMSDYADAGDLLTARSILLHKEKISKATSATFSYKLDMTVKHHDSVIDQSSQVSRFTVDNTTRDGFSFIQNGPNGASNRYSNGKYYSSQGMTAMTDAQAISVLSGYIDPLATELFWIQSVENTMETASYRNYKIDLLDCDPEMYEAICGIIIATPENMVSKHIYMTCKESSSGIPQTLTYWIEVETRQGYSITAQFTVEVIFIE